VRRSKQSSYFKDRSKGKDLRAQEELKDEQEEAKFKR
jgi:hypothetical protein